MNFHQIKQHLHNINNWILNWNGFIVLLLVALIFIVFLIYKNRKNKEYYCIDEVVFIGIKMCITKKNIAIASKIFIQLNTRKIAIPFDEENDLIVEVYNSWYSAFQLIRELLLELHPCEKNDGIIELGLEILNGEMREHLTVWQARFRKWYENELKNKTNDNLDPQMIQKKYPHYDELIKDLIDCQSRIITLNEQLCTHFRKEMKKENG